MAVFAYGAKEIEHLRKKDKKLGLAIDRIGPIEREVDPDPFSAIIGSIVSQQISNKAAETVLGRLLQSVERSPHRTLLRRMRRKSKNAVCPTAKRGTLWASRRLR